MIALALLLAAQTPANCEAIRTMSTPQTIVMSADVVPAGVFVAPPQPAPAGPPPAAAGRGRAGGAPAARPAPPEPIPQHCRVKLTLKPTSDSNIYSELWMPTDNWNGKLLVVGNGGFAGSIQGYGDMQIALRMGYATAATDTGHNAADGPVSGGMFALGHPEKIVDFAYRALHDTTVESKRLIKTMYSRNVQMSYYKGCSTGGRMGIMAAIRFPDDYDGIIAGALANRHIHMHTAGFARQVELARNPDMALSPEKAQLVNDAVMNKCNVLHETFLNNPQQCSFDFSTLLCKGGTENNECLMQPQLKAVEMFYGGVKNKKGDVIFAGQVLGNPVTPMRSNQSINVTDTVRIWAFQDEKYDWRSFDVDRDMPVIDQKIGFVDATDPDLRKFKAHGGKLLLYAGWADTGITPKNTVEYYQSVTKKMGKETTDFARLFMVPGMGHCRGGDGPDSFDSIGALEKWREKGQAPGTLAAVNKTSGLSRPLCAYPQYAKYKGTGDLKDAANWSCVAP